MSFCNRRALLLALSLSVAGCGTFPIGSINPVGPGGEDSLDPYPPATGQAVGFPVVEPDQGNVWVITQAASDDVITGAELVAINPQSGSYSNVLDVLDDNQSVILFPAPDRALYAAFGAQKGSYATLLSTASFQPIATATIPLLPLTLVPSPSGNFSSGVEEAATLTTGFGTAMVLDNQQLLAAAVPEQGQGMRTAWDHQSDSLLTASNTGTNVVVRRYPVAAGPVFGAPDVEVVGRGVQTSGCIFLTCIGVSPDDHWAVIPAIEVARPYLPILLVVDQTTGTVRRVPGIGPVGFTPDSSTIVAYGRADSGSLEFIDARTLAVQTLPIPTDHFPDFFVAQDGSQVVIANMAGADSTAVYDTSTQQTTLLQGSIFFDDFVVRPGHHQLWLVSGGDLYNLGLEPPSLAQTALPFQVGTLNILPTTDRLVMVPPTGGDIYFYSMANQSVDLQVTLPSP